MTHDLNAPNKTDDRTVGEPWYWHQPPADGEDILPRPWLTPDGPDMRRSPGFVDPFLPPIDQARAETGPFVIALAVMVGMAAGIGIALLASIWW